jgi:hypothetical protein
MEVLGGLASIVEHAAKNRAKRNISESCTVTFEYMCII